MLPSLLGGCCGVSFTGPGSRLFWIFLTLGLLGLSTDVLAHAVAQGDKGYIQETTGINLIAFIYLGAKHMVTGYDHLLFLLGVIFFLYRMQHIAIYVSLFALGHSTTMLLGVYFNVGINSYIIDAIIGLSIVYKALTTSGPISGGRLPAQHQGRHADLRVFHGFGLSTKIIEYDISPDGLIPNLLAFNVGVEIGQLIALAMILIVINFWRKTNGFFRHAYTANVAMMSAGFLLFGYQLTGYFVA